LNISILPISNMYGYNYYPRRRTVSPSFCGLKPDMIESASLSVRRLSRENFNEVYDIYLKYRESANVKSTVDAVKKYLLEENRRTDDEFFLAQNGETPAGFVQFGKEFSTLSGNIRYRIKALFVDENFRKSGVARQLIKALQNFVGDKELVVKARRNNKISPVLYQKTDFHEDDEFFHFVFQKHEGPL